MKTINCRFLLLALALTGGTLSAQETADDIIARYLTRVGGADRIRAVQTLRRTGTFYGGGGFEAAIRQENKRPHSVRDEFSLQGLTAINSYNGSTGWKIAPFGGKKDPEPLSEDELKDILGDAEFDDPLFDYRAKGNTVEFMGADQVEGSKAYKLRLTLKSNGDVRTYYMDADSYVPIRIEIKRTVRGAEREIEVTLGDYKEVSGWYLPHAIEVGTKGSPDRVQTTWQRIEANVPIDDRRFERPAPGVAVKDPAAVMAQAQQGQPPEQAAPETTPAARTGPRGGVRAVRPLPQRLPPEAYAAVRVDSETISGLGARNIGSAAMSGRVAAIAAVHEGGRLTVYVGSASGGVWKSMNGGTTFKPVFDKQPVQSIGAVTVDPTNPKVVWVGTGEAWTRNSVSIGDGVYKSTDAGENWTNVGLKESERIARILVDPSSPNTVYVCVPGKLWSDSDERGVYKTTDGGTTWTRVLAGTNASTGCSMLTMDPHQPQTLYAGMWDFRRKGWTFRSGGDSAEAPSGSGLFKSVDGGATWAPLDAGTARGLPPKPWGRVAVAVAPSRPDVVYAFIEAVPPQNALYRSDDGGRTWAMKDRSQGMVWRPFYFANLIVDPRNENRLYKPGGGLSVSNDGGTSLSDISGSTHGDFHDVWVDPDATDHLIAGDDGGLWFSYDAGDKWWKADNLPISQFYHVSIDMDRPYHVYGGLQDNSSWVGESMYPGGITSSRWENMYGGDGFWMFVDPTDPTYLYAEAQGGEIGRVNRKTHETRSIKPLPLYREKKLRFNWNTPIHVSPTRNGTIYIGSQFLFRSRDFGQTWERISPDLTTNDTTKQQQEKAGGVTVDNSSAEMHTTIYAIAESPLNPQVIWVGTDDGNLQVTRNGGRTWTNVVANIPGLARNAWVSSLEPGHFDAGTVYATMDLHTFGDMRAYAYKSTDYGKTWTPLVAGDSPVRGYAHVIKEDLVSPQLLFLGTEFGLWVSADGGRQWARYKGNDMPSVAVRDLAIHPRDDDLVIATHGRGIWIVDDITPLRALGVRAGGAPVAFLQTKPVIQRMPAGGGWASGDAAFVGPNPPDDAVITYRLQHRHVFGDMKLEVLDSAGTLITTLPTSKRVGLSRARWGMRMPPPRVPPAAAAAFGAVTGPRYLPGRYTLVLTEGTNVATAPLDVTPDPRSKATAADRKAEFQLATRIYATLGEMTTLVEHMNAVRSALDDRAARLTTGTGTLGAQLRAASATVDSMRKKIVATREGGMITGEERLRENLTDLYGSVLGFEGRPTQTQEARATAIRRELMDIRREFDGWRHTVLGPLNTALAAQQMEPVAVPGEVGTHR